MNCFKTDTYMYINSLMMAMITENWIGIKKKSRIQLTI